MQYIYVIIKFRANIFETAVQWGVFCGCAKTVTSSRPTNDECFFKSLFNLLILFEMVLIFHALFLHIILWSKT